LSREGRDTFAVDSFKPQPGASWNTLPLAALLRGDWVIVTANSVGATLSASVLAFNIRDMRAD
jgi:hypothetical protein